RFEATLEEERHRLPHGRTGRYVEAAHDLVPVELRADRVQLFGGVQLDDAGFEIVDPLGQCGGSLLVARRAVASGQYVQLVQQIAGVAHVAPHGGIRPPHAIRVESQVELDEPADLLDVV